MTKLITSSSPSQGGNKTIRALSSSQEHHWIHAASKLSAKRFFLKISTMSTRTLILSPGNPSKLLPSMQLLFFTKPPVTSDDLIEEQQQQLM